MLKIQGFSGQYPMAELLAARNRTLAAPTFAAGGLYLTEVEYPGFALPGLDASAEIRENV